MSVGVNYLREHIIQEARVHYSITGDLLPPNVVPNYARIWFVVRAPERDQLLPIYDRILQIADGADLIAGTTHKAEFVKGIHNVIPNKTLSEIVVKNMRYIGVPEYTEDELNFAKEIAKSISDEDKKASLQRSKRPGWEKIMNEIFDQNIYDAWDEGEKGHGSSDVADVSWNTPTMEFRTSTWVLGTPGHSWQSAAQSGMGIGYKSMIFAAKTIALSILDLMTNPELLKKAKTELEGRLNGREYKSPVPSEIKAPINYLEGKDVRIAR
jgi:aminobenzoyl-glutamate utilization protein B